MKKDIFIPLALIILLILLLEPFGFMPSAVIMAVLVLIVAAFAVFSIFLWREKGLDEREESHIHKADRLGFVFGALVLIVAIVAESLAHMLSPWLVLALIVMLFAKSTALIYEKKHH